MRGGQESEIVHLKDDRAGEKMAAFVQLRDAAEVTAD